MSQEEKIVERPSIHTAAKKVRPGTYQFHAKKPRYEVGTNPPCPFQVRCRRGAHKKNKCGRVEGGGASAQNSSSSKIGP